MSDAQDGRSYSGIVIGAVSYAGLTLTLQRISENQVIRYSVSDNERELLEQITGQDVTIFCWDGRVGEIVDNVNLRNQRSVVRGW